MGGQPVYGAGTGDQGCNHQHGVDQSNDDIFMHGYIPYIGRSNGFVYRMNSTKVNSIKGILRSWRQWRRELGHSFVALRQPSLWSICGLMLFGCSNEPPTTFEAMLGSRDVVESAVITLDGDQGEIEIEPKEGKATKGKVKVVKREELRFIITLVWENGATGQMDFLRRPYSMDTGWICNQCHDREKTGAPVDLPNMWKGSKG